MAAQQLAIVRGSTLPLTFTAQPVNGVVLTGQQAAAYAAFHFTVKRSSSDPDPGLNQSTPTLTNPGASTAAIWSFTVPASAFSQSAGMPDWDYLVYWELTGIDSSGEPFSIDTGTLLIQGSKNMTRATL